VALRAGVTPQNVSSEPNEQDREATERLVLWHRATSSSATEAEILGWRNRACTRLTVAGAEVVALAGASFGASFDPLELDDVLELGLDLLRDARNEAARLEVACGLALGELLRCEDDGSVAGSAIDRAQLLANCALPGELVLDEAVHARAEDGYLFARLVLAGAVTGQVLDRGHPRKSECRNALLELRPPRLPPMAAVALELLRERAAAPGTRRIALRASAPHVALDRLERLRAMLEPALVLHFGRQAGALQPLGSLQLALQRAHASMSSLDDVLRSGVARLLQGAAVSREEAVVTLRELLRQASGTGLRPWIVLERPLEHDPASLAVLLEALDGQTPDHVLWLLLDERGGVPAALARIGEREEISLEPLTDADRTLAAEAVLGLEPGSEIGQRVARLGGDTLLGIVEAARTLVGSGDLVLQAGAFVWRTRARNASLPIPIDGLLTERASGLDPQAQRALQVLCVAPPAASTEFVQQVAALDGMPPAGSAAGLEQLQREGWLDARGSLGPLEHAIRNAVRNGMPPARAAELHRFVAEALATQPPPPGGAGFVRGQVAHHLIEGGREREAAEALLDCAQAATDGGFPRVGVRLAALARKLDGSKETMRRARQVAGTVDHSGPSASHTLPPEAEVAPVGSFAAAGPRPEPAQAADPRQLAAASIGAAVAAIARGELDVAESLIDTAVAAGWGRHAAQRLSSLVQLAKGHVPEAVRALKQARVPDAEPGTRSREALAAALILLESGETLDALRATLEGLCGARRAGDARGERVALHVLSDCYRALGQDAQAERVAAAGAALGG
jgi:hypothetical protein